MRIIARIPVVDKQKQQDLFASHWVKLEEPGTMLTAILASVPFMVLNFTITLLIVGMFVPVSLQYFGIAGSSFSFQIDLLPLVFGVAGILVAHELVHLLCIPDFIRSDITGVGITYGGGFVYTEEPLTRTRFVIISFAPFIAISVILPFLLGMLHLLSPLITGLLLLNSLGSSVDILMAVLVLMQVPPGAHLVATGRETYWKTDG
jgi:hypothetical protein